MPKVFFKDEALETSTENGATTPSGNEAITASSSERASNLDAETRDALFCSDSPQGDEAQDEEKKEMCDQNEDTIILSSPDDSQEKDGGTQIRLSDSRMEELELGLWKKETFKEDRIYSLNECHGMIICKNRDNRDDQKRGKEFYKLVLKGKSGREPVNIVNPIDITTAKIAKEAGFSLSYRNFLTGKDEPLPDEWIEKAFCILDGHGRYEGYLDSLKDAKTPNEVMKLKFIYKEYNDPKKFKQEFISVNYDVKKTTRDEIIGYASVGQSNQLLIEYNSLVQSEKFVAKAAQLHTFGKELSTTEMNQILRGESFSEDKDLVSAMKQAKSQFFANFSEKNNDVAKFLKGVILAKWLKTNLSNSATRDKNLERIESKLKSSAYRKKIMDSFNAKGSSSEKETNVNSVLNEIINI